MKLSQTIKLNGTIYTRENLDIFFAANEPKDSWQNQIYAFLQNWFDDSDFILSHTSGSTGKPKEIRLKKVAMEYSARMTNQFFGLDAEKTALLCLPASYIAGKMMLVRALVGGCNLVTVEPKANPFENIDIEIDFAAITPYQLTHSADSLKTRIIRKIIVGGSPVTNKLEKLAERIPSELYETYGMTETCSHIALRCFNGAHKSDYFTVLSGVTIRQDERECLAIKAPHLLENEIQTNDIVKLVGSKSFRWLGRADSVINSGGVKIFPEQVEKKLEGTISCNFFITSMPDELLDNKVILVVESNQLADNEIDNLNLKFKRLLSKYEIPKEIYFLQNFVYSASNKVLKKATIEKITSR